MASITAKINTKYDNKGINDATKGLQSLGKVASGVGLAFKGFVAIKALGAINSLASGSIKAFSDSQTSSTALLQSVSNNLKMTEGAYARLTASANAFQKTFMFDADDINKNQRFLSDMNLSEEQINSTMKAAMNMASSGVMPLDEAVQTLGKTHTGTAGQLGKMNGEIKSLTKEQLKNGEAVAIIAKQYAGYADTMTNTFTGKDLQFGNIMGDLKESIGAIGGSFKFLAQDFAMPWIEKLTTFFSANRDKIINFVINLPEIVGMVGKTIADMIPKIFTLDFWIGYLKIVGSFFITAFKNILTTIFNLIVAIGETFWQPLKYGFDSLGWSIQSIFIGIINGLNGMVENFVNGFISSINKITSIIPNAPKIEAISFLKLQSPDKPKNEIGQNIGNAWKNVGIGIVDGLAETKDAYVNGFKNMGTLLSETFGEDIGNLKNSVENVLGKELPDNLQKALNPKASSASTGATGETGAGGLMEALGGMKGIADMFGQLGKAIKFLMSGNPLMILVQLITSFVSMFAGIENVSKVLNIFGTIFERTGEIIGPIVNTMLAPLVDILSTIGQIVGVILAPVFKVLGEMLLPVFNVISILLNMILPFVNLFSILISLFVRLSPALNLVMAGFTLLANGLTFIFNKILTPIINWVIKLITGVGNLIIGLFNGIVGILKSINIFGWHPFGGMSTVGQLNYDEMKLSEITATTGATGETGASGTNSGASYTAAKDVVINIIYNNSYINGDCREIALNLRKEIRLAEGLNY